MNVSKYFIVALFAIVSCQNDNRKTTNDDLCFIDIEADYRLYKLDILNGDSDGEYKILEDGKCFVLVKNDIYSLGINFGESKNLPKALEHYRKNKDISNDKGLYRITSISIQKPSGEFSEVWHWKNPIEVHADGGYGIHEFRLWLEDSNFRYKEWYSSGIQIFLKHDFNGEGYKMYSFNYVRENELWKLVSRECVNTTGDVPLSTYCIDTINSNCLREAGVFSLTFESLKLDDAICY